MYSRVSVCVRECVIVCVCEILGLICSLYILLTEKKMYSASSERSIQVNNIPAVTATYVLEVTRQRFDNVLRHQMFKVDIV